MRGTWATYGDSDLLKVPLNASASDPKDMNSVVSLADAAVVKLSGGYIGVPSVTPAIRIDGPTRAETTLQADRTFTFPRILSGTYTWCCNSGYTSITVPGKDTNVVLRAIEGRVMPEDGMSATDLALSANDATGVSAAFRIRFR